MADITKTNHKGLGLPKHFDPSMEQMKKNMEVIDDILQKAVPNDLTSITDAKGESNANTLKETGNYFIKSNASNIPPVSGFAGIISVFKMGAYILQEWRSINSPKYTYRRYSTNTGSSWSSWIKEWNASNDGYGSGLDADTIDGLDSTAFFRTGLTQTSNFNDATSEGKYRITGTTNAPYTGCTDWICVVYHLGNTTNELYQIAYEECNNVPTGISGGSTSSYSSMPLIFVRKKISSSSWTSWQCLWHSGNDGANSGMNADMLDGYHASTFMQVSAFEAYMEAHKGYDYVIASQADFDAMIADDKWFGAERILFLCDVRASGDAFSQKAITIPDFVKYIEGLHHTISHCSGFGYESVPDDPYISNLGIRNLKIYNSNASGSQVYGFKNCINLYGCAVSLDSLCPSIICFDNCNNLTNCFGWVQSGSSANYSNVNIKVFNKCSNLTHCTCQNAYANENTAGYYVFYECTNLNECICYQREDNYGYSVFYKCDYLYGCKISQRYTTSIHTFVVGFEQCTNLTKCSSDTAGTTATYKECNVLIDCEGTDSSVDCEKIFKSSQILHSVDGGTYENPTIINERSDLPRIIKGGYSAFVNPVTGTVLKRYYPHQPVIVLDFDGEPVDTNGDLFFEYTNPVGSFIVLSGDSAEIQYYKIDTQNDTLELKTIFDKILERDGTGSGLDADLLDGYEGSAYLRIANLLTEISKVDGSGSGLDADLLDGQHEYQMAKYGTASGSFLTTGDPTATNTGGCQMYRFQDSSNLIGEGSSRYYGVIQIYYSASYYIRIAVSMTSGKVYRQTSSQIAWSEITPKIEVLTSDPTSPSDGQIWVVTG